MGTSDVGQFFVVGPTYVATKPSHFYCRICSKDLCVLTHGHNELLRHFQGSKHFPLDQQLKLVTPVWEVLDHDGKFMSPAEVERQRERIMRAPLVVRDREYHFSEDVIVEETGAVDPNVAIMAKLSSLTEVLRLGGNYALMYTIWAQFNMSAVRVNVDVTWLRVEVLVIISICPVLYTLHVCIQFVACLVHHSRRDVTSDFSNFVSLNQLGKITRKLQRGFRRTRRRSAGLSLHLG